MAKDTAIGLKEANRAIRRLPELARDEAQQTFDVTAFQFARMASSAAPRDEGDLADAISWAPRPRSLSAVVLVNTAKAPHWKFQEYGTVHHGAHAYLRPTAVRLSPDHQARLAQGLERAGAKMEREARG